VAGAVTSLCISRCQGASCWPGCSGVLTCSRQLQLALLSAEAGGGCIIRSSGCDQWSMLCTGRCQGAGSALPVFDMQHVTGAVVVASCCPAAARVCVIAAVEQLKRQGTLQHGTVATSADCWPWLLDNKLAPQAGPSTCTCSSMPVRRDCNNLLPG
jgi:hypothetical protein